MIAKLLYNLTARLHCRLINLPSGRYLERYFLGDHFGRTWYLHRFVRNDSERHLHNHPWRKGWSLILTGWYDEEGATDICPHAGPAGVMTEVHRRRWYNRIDGATVHRIVAARAETWTLVCTSERQRLPDGSLKGWGFFEQQPDVVPRSYEWDCAHWTPPEGSPGAPGTLFKPVHSLPVDPKQYPLGRDADRAPFGAAG